MLPGGVGIRIVGASVDEGSVSLAMEGDHEMSLRHGCSLISTCIIRKSAFYVYNFTIYLTKWLECDVLMSSLGGHFRSEASEPRVGVTLSLMLYKFLGSSASHAKMVRAKMPIYIYLIEIINAFDTAHLSHSIEKYCSKNIELE
jgi:hypothetical protein